MSKVKVPRKSTWVDMTAMTDVAFLLLTFFILATQAKPEEVVMVDTPSSVADIKLPGTNVMLITVDSKGRVFFGTEGQEQRRQLLDNMAARKQLSFTPEEIHQFSLLASVGTPIAELKPYLALTADARKAYNEQTKGVPLDSLNNELSDWVLEARRASGGEAIITIKGDRNADIKVIKRIIATLQDQKANRFSFITSMEAKAK